MCQEEEKKCPKIFWQSKLNRFVEDFKRQLGGQIAWETVGEWLNRDLCIFSQCALLLPVGQTPVKKKKRNAERKRTKKKKTCFETRRKNFAAEESRRLWMTSSVSVDSAAVSFSFQELFLWLPWSRTRALLFCLARAVSLPWIPLPHVAWRLSLYLGPNIRTYNRGPLYKHKNINYSSGCTYGLSTGFYKKP